MIIFSDECADSSGRAADQCNLKSVIYTIRPNSPKLAARSRQSSARKSAARIERMEPQPATTHLVSVQAVCGLVLKSFRSRKRREPERECAALTLLVRSAPWLSAAPVRADLDADPPVIEMFWLPGVPLGGACSPKPRG